MGGISFVIAITLSGIVYYSLVPGQYGGDLILLSALYLSFFSDKPRTVVLVWILGIMRGMLSCSSADFPVFYPIFFLSIYLVIAVIKRRIKLEHPFTQFIVLFSVSVLYYFIDILFTEYISLSRKIFSFWHYLGGLAFLNALIGLLVFTVLKYIPIDCIDRKTGKIIK